MILWIIAGVVFLVCVAVAVYLLFFQDKGKKILLEVYEMRGENNYKRIFADKTLFGYQRREKEVEKLFLPKKIATKPIKAISSSNYIDTDMSYPIVRILRLKDNLVEVLDTTFDIDSKEFKHKAEDIDNLSWLIRENEQDEKDFGEKPSAWAQIAPYVSFALIGIVAILAMYFTSQHFEETSRLSAVELRQDLNNQANFINDVLQYCNEGGEIPTFVNTTADRPLTNTTT